MDSAAAVLLAAEPVKAIDPLGRFDTYFRTSSADTPQLLETSLALRYQVYCLERQFEDPAKHADLREKDEFDHRSVHSLIFYRPQDEAIGTVRIILADPEFEKLPIQKLLRQTGLNPSVYFKSENTGEISRFAISKEFRRRHSPLLGAADKPPCERQTNLPCLGLIQSILRQSIKFGISTWAAMMEPQLLRMLASMGIRFTPIGPLVNHHGLRQPSFCRVPQMLKVLAFEKPANWAVVTNDGELFYPAEASTGWRGDVNVLG
jgi:N-acyl amino acid synthase of PEP-CTERM/exosortase system